MKNKLIELAYKLNEFNKKFAKNKNRFVAFNKVYNSKFLFMYHFVKDKNFVDSPYRHILLNYFKKSDRYYPGSSYFLSVYLVEKILNISTDKKSNNAEHKLDNIFKYLSNLTSDKAFDLFHNILKFSGPDATIQCETTKNSQILVEKKCDPEFKINIDEAFSNVYFSNQSKTTKSFMISIVDGFIERESELIPLIEKAKVDNAPCILICRGMSDNARKHLKNILLTNKVYLYPYICKFDNSDPFLLDDIAKISNIKKISSDFLDNIYKHIVEKSGIVKATLQKDKIIFFEKSDSLISEINQKLSESLLDSDLKNYLQKRKLRCSPNIVNVSIPFDQIELLTEIKALIVCYNHCVKNGLIKFKNNNLQSKYMINIIEITGNKLYNSVSNLGLTIKSQEN